MHTISIVVPSYNHAGYVEACLDSIYIPGLPGFEMIIVDDRSTDGSADIIHRMDREGGN
jgi:glycosyltransferase involved in cell wall biosynthesis